MLCETFEIDVVARGYYYLLFTHYLVTFEQMKKKIIKQVLEHPKQTVHVLQKYFY